MNNIIIIVPTLNEKNNIEDLVAKLNVTGISYDLLFVDDNSIDGTQEIIKNMTKKYSNINYIFRPKKMGIGSAHKEGLIWSFERNYKIIITMDADGTHHPKYISFMIEELKNFDIVTTSRFLEKNALEGWPIFRVFLTTLRHIMISLLLSMPYDSSGAFRCINCKKISLPNLILAKNNSYSYFWESIFILYKKKYRIGQIPIRLPYRKIGSSKMQLKDIFFAVCYLIIVFFKKILGKYNYKHSNE